MGDGINVTLTREQLHDIIVSADANISASIVEAAAEGEFDRVETELRRFTGALIHILGLQSQAVSFLNVDLKTVTMKCESDFEFYMAEIDNDEEVNTEEDE